MKVEHDWSDDTATISVEGLKGTVRMLHATDPHVAWIDDRDAEFLDSCEEYCHQCKWRISVFQEMMASTKSLGVDVVALTGDIVAFPAQAVIETIRDAIDQVEVPVLYTCGNHDWVFPGLDGAWEELRETWRPVLEPLHHGRAACDRYDIGGVQFILVDNSTYQVDEEQLAFFEGHLSNGMPTVVLMHIPMTLPTLRGPTIEEKKVPILMGETGWDQESRRQCGIGEDLPSTFEFVRVLETAENLVAVFCGHIHFAHVDRISPNAVQYVGPPVQRGKKRVFEFRPL